MIDDDQKRKKWIKYGAIGLGALLLIIILIAIFSSGSSKKTSIPISCKLQVTTSQLNDKDEYIKEVTIEFESMTGTDLSKITEYGMGTKKEYNKNKEYVLATVGTSKIYGYVKDEKGKEASCEIEVKIVKGDECKLEVKEGTIGKNSWYVSEVKVGFKLDNNKNIEDQYAKYHIIKKNDDQEEKNNDEYVVVEDGITEIVGYLEDAKGKVTTCKLNVKKDATLPVCTLKVNRGTFNDKIYTTDVEVVIDKTNDTGSESVVTGVGIEKNYEKTTYIVKNKGITTVYGYIKDTAGNENTCNISIDRGDENGNPTTIQESPTCTLIASGTLGENNWYIGNATVKFSAKSPSTNATITKFGIGTAETYENGSGFNVTNDGTTTIYGYVEDSNGKKGNCSIAIKKDTNKPACTLKVSSDSYNNASSTYVGNVTVSINSKTDETSGVATYGIGTSKIYNNSSYKITSDGAFTITGYVKDGAGNENTCSVSFKAENVSLSLLADSVSVGDYVEYDAGNWTETKTMPTSSTPFIFGGYTSGTSKNNSVTCYGSYANASNGWRVLSKSGGVVTLVHAGTPECYHHPYISGQTNLAYNSEKILTGATSGSINSAYPSTPRNWSTYVNGTYATGATILNKAMVDTAPSDLVVTGSYYYVGTSNATGAVWGVSSTGAKTGYSMFTYGVRPVVTLKANIKTPGKNTSGAWKLSN